MLADLFNFYSGEVTGVSEDEIKVKIPALDIEIPVYEVMTFGYDESKSGYFFQLPKVGDSVLITFERGDYHRPILLLGQKISVEKIKKDKEFIKTKLLKIIPETTEGPENFEVDYENKKILIKSPVIEVKIDLNSGVISGTGSGGNFEFNLLTGNLRIFGTQATINMTSFNIMSSNIIAGVGSPLPLIKGPLFDMIFSTHMHPLVNPLVPGFSGPPIPPTTSGSWTLNLKGG